MRGSRPGAVVLLTVLVVFGMTAPGGALAVQQSEPPSDLPDSQVFQVNSGGQIHAWERAAYTLRTDDTDAATRIGQPATVQGERLGAGASFTDENDGVDSKSLIREFGNERNPMSVHDSDTQVTIAFDANRASGGSVSQLNGQGSVEIVAARLTPVEGRDLPASTGGAFDLLSDIDAANRNASFEVLDNDAQLSATGQLTTTASFAPGQYVVFAAVHESNSAGIETSATGANVGAGNISVEGAITVIGMDQLAVQETAPSVTPPSEPTVGESLTFDVDATSAFDATEDGRVTHAVAVYHESTFEDARFDLVVDQSAFGPGLSLANDAQLEHSISRTNGVASVEPGVTINGNNLGDGQIARPAGIASVLDFVADEAGANDPSTHPISVGGANNTETETLDASVTSASGEDRATSVPVDTFENFSTGSYRYLVVSTLDDESRISTATGTLTLGSGGGDEDTGDTDDDGGDDDTDSGDIDDDTDSGDTDSGDTDDDDGGGTVVQPPDTPAGDDPPTPEQVTTTPPGQDNESTAVPVPTVEANQTIAIEIGDTANGTQDVANGTRGTGNETPATRNDTQSANSTQPAVQFQQVNITSQEEATDVQIRLRESGEPSDETPSNDRAVTTSRYINVDLENIDDPDRTPGSFTFEMSTAERAELGVTPAEVRMYRYNNQTWDAIPTTHLGGDEFRADTPGFSWFAVGTNAQSINVTDASLNATAVRSGNPAAVTATLENTGGADGNLSVELAAGSQVIETRTVFVEQNASTVESFTFSPDTAGTYRVTVGGVVAGTVTVSQSAATSGPAVETAAQTGSTFLGGGNTLVFVVTAIVVGLAGLLAGLRRRDKL